MIDPNRIFKLADGISMQNLGEGEGAVVLEIASGQLHTCNDTSAEFLGALDGRRRFSEVVDILESKFDVGREELEQDIAALAQQLIAQRVII